MTGADRPAGCPVTAYERAGEGYADQVVEWISNPHAYFKAFGREAREFQRRHRSERLRTMTFVAPAGELAPFRPVCLSLDGEAVEVASWQEAFARTAARLAAAHPQTFAALQEDGELAWLGCPADGTPVAEALDNGGVNPQFASWDEVVGRIQWLFLMCGIRLNEAIVQVDPYTDDAWRVRADELRRKRAEERAFMEGRRAAQKAWAEAHPEGTLDS